MDVTAYLDLRIAPRAVFDRLPAWRDRPRFLLPAPGGGWRPLTWGEFAADIRRIALFLAGEGLASGDRAAIFAPNRVEWMSAALAIQAAGGAMVPVYPNSTTEQAAYVVAHSDARVLFVDTAALLERVFAAWGQLGGVQRVVLLSDTVEPLAVLAGLRQRGGEASGAPSGAPSPADVETRVLRWSRALELGAAVDRAQPERFERTMDAVSLDQMGVMLYTSGTTGNPKGVPLTHRNVGVNGRDWLVCNAPLLEEGDVDLLWLPLSHIFGFGQVCLGTTLGFTTYVSDPLKVLGHLAEVRPHVFMSVPRYWEKLAAEAARGATPAEQRERLDRVTGGRLRFCLSGGAGLKPAVKELLHRNGLLVIEGYGLTESSPTLTLNRLDDFRFDSVGKPLPSVTLRLAEDGEILAKGDNVFAGYHKDPQATAEVLTEDGWLKTGDVGRFTEDGFLQIVDRKKDILVTAGGKNVPPANIELRFADDPWIAHLVVYGDGQPYLVAGVWPNEPAVAAWLAERGVPVEEQAAAVRALLQERVDLVNAELARYETIKRFQVMSPPLTVEGGLLTAALKVKRKRVYEVYRDVFEGLYAAPAASAAGAGVPQEPRA
jgi:long-chain acyl-CoA synthetase